MVFSSLVFICVFLPAVMLLYWIIPGSKQKNALLLMASLLFYAYGEPFYILLLLFSCMINAMLALLLQTYRDEQWPGTHGIMIIAVVGNLVLLGVYKYADLLISWFNALTGLHVPLAHVSLPIGISFFTFQALSYVIDVYRGDVKAQKNIFRVILYISFFPQLIAGPIVKYHEVEQQLQVRSAALDDTVQGIHRFIIGLSKKVLIANTMAVLADTLFGAETSLLNAFGAWVAAISYMLQIYFDFSGYSDMAIGLGRIFGFHFQENFCYPYSADSIREFWRRWHISLSGWFREYLYFPLGGNRMGKARTVFNKFIVFACTGIWHGANMTFLFWGLYHGCLLMIEEYVPFFNKQISFAGKCIRHVYVLIAVMIGFVFFRADSMKQGCNMVKMMITGWNMHTRCMQTVVSLLTPEALCAAAVGMIASVPWKIKTCRSLKRIGTTLLFILCMLRLAEGTYNPFIYFRF